MRGNLAISLVAGIASYIVLKIMGVPYAETLAVLVAILDIVPLVGATIGAVIVCIVGFATGGAVDGIVLVVFFVLYQQFENNVLQNVVYSKTVSLSPLVVFIAALDRRQRSADRRRAAGHPARPPPRWVLGRDLSPCARRGASGARAGGSRRPGAAGRPAGGATRGRADGDSGAA